MAIEVSGLQSGATVTDDTVTLSVTAKHYQLSCAEAGKPNKDSVGQYHVELDHALVNMYCTPTATISMQNVAPGKHSLTVLPHQERSRRGQGRVGLDRFHLPAGAASGRDQSRG